MVQGNKITAHFVAIGSVTSHVHLCRLDSQLFQKCIYFIVVAIIV